MGKEISPAPPQSVQTDPAAQIRTLQNVLRILSPGVNRPGHKVHSSYLLVRLRMRGAISLLSYDVLVKDGAVFHDEALRVVYKEALQPK